MSKRLASSSARYSLPAPVGKLCIALFALQVIASQAAAAAPPNVNDQASAAQPSAAPAPRTQAPAENIVPPEPDSVVPADGEPLTIDLQTAWRLAGVQNPTINVARMAIAEAEAAQRQAVLAWLPNMNAGSMVHVHTGSLLTSFGGIRRLSEVSVYAGGGTRALAAESPSIPMVQFFVPFAETLFNPLAARQQTTVRRFNASATSNNILLDTTTAYLDLLAAEVQLQAYGLSRHNVQQVVDTTGAYARTGQGRQGDANRALAEALLLQVDIQQAQETLAVSSAALARLLHLDPSTRLKTPGGPMRTFDLVDMQRPLPELIEVAVRYRPEMSARSMAIAESRTRVRQERARPLLPLVTTGFSTAGFGGTGNFAQVPPVTPFNSFPSRVDLDVAAVWTLRNMGAGNIASANQRRAQLNASIYDRVRIENQVRREVTEAYGFALGERRQVAVAMRRLNDAEMAFGEDYQRLLGFEALPIEVLNSARLLIAARSNLVDAFIGDNTAQFRLFVAMGQPPFRATETLREQLPQQQNPLEATPQQ